MIEEYLRERVEAIIATKPSGWKIKTVFDKRKKLEDSGATFQLEPRILEITIGFKEGMFSIKHLPMVWEHELIHLDLFLENLDDLYEYYKLKYQTDEGIQTSEFYRAILTREKRVWRRFLEGLNYPMEYLEIAQMSLNTYVFGPAGYESKLFYPLNNVQELVLEAFKRDFEEKRKRGEI